MHRVGKRGRAGGGGERGHEGGEAGGTEMLGWPSLRGGIISGTLDRVELII